MDYTPVIDQKKATRALYQRSSSDEYVPRHTKHSPTKSSPLKHDSTTTIGDLKIPRGVPMTKPKQSYNTTINPKTGESNDRSFFLRCKELEDEISKLKKDTASRFAMKDSQILEKDRLIAEYEYRIKDLAEWYDGTKLKFVKYHDLYQESQKEIKELKKALLEKSLESESSTTTSDQQEKVNDSERIYKIVADILPELLDKYTTSKPKSEPVLSSTPLSKTTSSKEPHNKESYEEDEDYEEILKVILKKLKNSNNIQSENVGNETAKLLDGSGPQFKQVPINSSPIRSEMDAIKQKWDAVSDLKEPIKRLNDYFNLKDIQKQDQKEVAELLQRVAMKLKEESENQGSLPKISSETQRDYNTQSHIHSCTKCEVEQKEEEEEEQKEEEEEEEEHRYNKNPKHSRGTSFASYNNNTKGKQTEGEAASYNNNLKGKRTEGEIKSQLCLCTKCQVQKYSPVTEDLTSGSNGLLNLLYNQ